VREVERARSAEPSSAPTRERGAVSPPASPQQLRSNQPALDGRKNWTRRSTRPSPCSRCFSSAATPVAVGIGVYRRTAANTGSSRRIGVQQVPVTREEESVEDTDSYDSGAVEIQILSRAKQKMHKTAKRRMKIRRKEATKIRQYNLTKTHTMTLKWAISCPVVVQGLHCRPRHPEQP
jgi:hypothetical protein